MYRVSYQLILWAIIPVVAVAAAATPVWRAFQTEPPQPREAPLWWPATSDTTEVVSHPGFSLRYSERHEQAIWVAYMLTGEMTRPMVPRSNDFRIDPKVSTGSATHTDYRGSGFDRGHLAPAGDMGWSAASMSASFFYSNMSPQRPSNNRGVWKRLEEQVRRWALAYDTLYVVTGPLLHDSLPCIGPSCVSVPEAYYKALLRHGHSGSEGIAFVVPNEGSREALTTFAISLDSLERLTGLDFFPLLPDSLGRSLEQRLCEQCWEW